VTGPVLYALPCGIALEDPLCRRHPAPAICQAEVARINRIDRKRQENDLAEQRDVGLIGRKGRYRRFAHFFPPLLKRMMRLFAMNT
jgi:hypothetical protein